MADAGIDLSIRTDSTQAGAGVREVEEAIRRAGRTSEEASRRTADAAQRNLQLYREETRILDLRARGRNDIADALRAEVDIRRMGMRLERELHVSQERGLELARRRLAAERAAAEEAARRNGAGGGPGGAPPPDTSGGRRRGAGGGQDEDGSGPPPPGGRPPRRGGGPPPPGGPDRGRDLNDTYYVLQDLIQGGVGAVANQMPIILRLLGQYGGALAGAAAAIGGGIAIGYAMTSPDGVKGKLADFANKLDGVIGAFPTQASIRDGFMTWLAEKDEGVKAMNETAKAQDKALKAFNVRRDQELARRQGEAQGDNARNRAEGLRISREYQDAETKRQDDERDRQAQLNRLKLEGIQDVEARTKALAEFDKRQLTERAARVKRMADDGFDRAAAAAAAAKAELDALEKAADKAKLAPGVSGTTPELEKLNAARSGLKEAAQVTAEALRAAAAARAQAQSGIKAADDEGRIIDQKTANADADRQAAEAKKNADDFVSAGRTFINAMLGMAEDVPKIGREQNKARGDRGKEMQILELRSRGQNRRADRLQRNADIEQAADALQKGPGMYSREDALKEAAREYDLRNPSRRIRGAGFGGPGRGGKNRSRTDFTGIDGVDYTGANGDGGLDHRSFKGANGNGGLDGQSWGGANGDGGLDALRRLNDRSRRGANAGGAADKQAGPDGLDALQSQNRKVRGAGFKGTKAVAEAALPAAAAAMPGGAAALPAILNAISGLGRKLDTLTAASRSVRK